MSPIAVIPESTFWYWIQERHSIYLKKSRYEPKPWTNDRILQEYKFTNVFRELDTGTIWLRKNFLEPHWNDDPSLIVFNVCFYRMFNWVGTGELLGWQTHWNPAMVKRILNDAMSNKIQVFTGAHMVRSAFGMSKIECIVNVCTELWELRHEILKVAMDSKNLQMTFERLLQIKWIGPFMAYEMVTDLRHTRVLGDANDIQTWANPGPGAQRGLQRLLLPWKPDREALESMRWLRERSRENLPEWIPDLEIRDIEHSLCETDKYCRAKFGEGRPRSRYPGVAS